MPSHLSLRANVALQALAACITKYVTRRYIGEVAALVNHIHINSSGQREIKISRWVNVEQVHL